MKSYALNTEKRRFARQKSPGYLLAELQAYACMDKRLREEAVLPTLPIFLDRMGVIPARTNTN